jgi:hypothetical protein
MTDAQEGIALPEPITIGIAIIAWIAHHIATVAVVVYVLALTVVTLEEWVRARSHIGAGDDQVIAVELASRLANKNYIEMPNVFRNQPANTRMVQAIYNKRTGQVLDSRRIASHVSPAMEVINRHAAGNGMVVYT